MVFNFLNFSILSQFFVVKLLILPFLSTYVLIMMYNLTSQLASISLATCGLHRIIITVNLKIKTKLLLLLYVLRKCHNNYLLWQWTCNIKRNKF